VVHPASKQSQVISEEVGKYLVENGWITPELSDDEYQIQIALGSIDYRVYRMGATKENEGDKINDFKRV
jgi:hypothetical protein